MNDCITFGPTTAPSRETEVKRFLVPLRRCDFILLLRSLFLYIVKRICPTLSLQAVNDATHILCRNRTCLILTRHRQTIEAADHIALMYRGRVIEQGTLEELQNQGRLYHLLTSLQDVDED